VCAVFRRTGSLPRWFDRTSAVLRPVRPHLSPSSSLQLQAFARQLRNRIRTVRDLRDTQTQERRRLVKLFLWLKVFCHNARLHEERDDLRDKIDMMIPDDIREEVIQMGKTMAEHDRDVARIEHSRSTLLRQLRRRFGEIPDDMVAIIEATKDQGRLEGWLDRFATADRLEDVGVG
jgi:hypothetical protein